MPFKPLLRMARAWLDEPSAVDLAALVAQGRGAAGDVPEHRRADWEKLLAGIERGMGDPEPRTRARVEGLVRACRLFGTPIDPVDPVDRLPGIGPTSRTALAENGVHTVADLLWVPPVGFDDLRAPVPLASAIEEARRSGGRGPRTVVSAMVKSAGIVPIRGRRSVRLLVHDATDEACKLHVFWFFMAHGVLTVAKPGAPLLLVGRVLVEGKKPARMAHPDLFADVPEMRGVRARYPKMGATGAAVRKAIAHALGGGLAPDPVPAAIAARERLPDVGSVLREVHAQERIPPEEPARKAFVERLAWAEAFTRVWERLSAEAQRDATPAPVLPPAPDAVAALVRELGFALTAGQHAAIDDVTRELAGARAMRRLLLGDVGTGKTAVALAAAAQCVRGGHQVAILAPTSVLAEQYLDAVRPLERAIGARVAFVAAGVPAAARREAEEAIRSGEADVAIGTHALLREGITFAKLGLVVVDEQQRLGVAQRLSLVKKGARPHLLTLSATPIPRTLALALRGELATSTLKERPAGRPPVETSLAPSTDLESVVRRVDETRRRGERVFWVVPRIDAIGDADDDEDVDPMASAIEREEMLRVALPEARVVMLHGAMSPVEKRRTMQAFRTGEADVLVGTTVIEVGVDVPEATLMVIEDAERFGLAQLHQLRGRVGRGAKPGSCILVHGDPLEGLARERLVALTELSSGEELARIDLELRGAGDLGGTRQHGVEEELLWLEPGATYPWLGRVEEDARALHASDPALAGDDHRVLGSLVRRMGHVIAVREEAG
jgi:ATP-dependent DNA helicase RecG